MKIKKYILAVLLVLILTTFLFSFPVFAANSCDHEFYYEYVNEITCMKKCRKCDYTSATSHSPCANLKTDYIKIPATCTTSEAHLKKCDHCGYSDISYNGRPSGHTPAIDDGDPHTPIKCTVCGAMLVRGVVDDMNSFAFSIYLAICRLAIPLAIVSFAFCGYKILGSIFFGTYASQQGGDIAKAQKQVVYTVLAVLFIVLLPRIFGAAVDIFEDSAWEP